MLTYWGVDRMGMSGSPRAPRALRLPALAAVLACSLGSLAAVQVTEGGAGARTPVSCTNGTPKGNALGPATGWTEFIEGNANRHNSESEGRAAYGGNLGNDGNWNQVAFKLDPATFPVDKPALVVGGTNSANVHLHVGSAYVQSKVGTVDFQGGTGTGYLASNPIDFAAAFTELRALSTSWGSAAATGTVTQAGDSANHRLLLTGTDSDLNVFSLTPADISWATAAIRLDVPAGATTIVNVSGTSVSFGGSTQKIEAKIGSSFQGLDDGNYAGFTGLVWNFPDATTISLNNGGAFAGAILAPRAAITVGSNVGHNTGQVIAKSFDSDRETHLPLFASDACVPGTPPSDTPADVRITKTASSSNPHGGDLVTYTLLVENLGDSAATGVVVTDALPPGVTFDSASAPCTQSGGTITCSIGDLAGHASASLWIKVVANPVAGAGSPSHPQADHWLTPYKAEAQVDLEPGQQRSVTLSCAAGDTLADGQFRLDHVDQNTGTIADDVHVLSSQLDGAGVGTWKGVIRNDATGRAQAKAFIVCLPAQTEAADRQTGYNDSHRHPILVDATPVTATAAYPAGRSSTTLSCPAGTIPIAPGFSAVGGGVTLAGSEYDEAHPRDWTFTLEASAAATATLSLRCLRTTTGPVYGHTHELRFVHLVQTVTVPGHTAPEGQEYQVICPDDAKGIVATWNVPPGVRHFGNDPRLKERAFRLFNDTGVDRTATVDLLCLRDRTSTEDMGTATPVTVDNTATVSAASDANPLNNSSTATISVQPGSATAGFVGGARLSGSSVSMRVVSSMPGKGALTVKAGGKVLARGSVGLRPGRSSTASLKLSKAAKRHLAKLDAVTVRIDPSRGKAVTRTIRVG